VAKAYADFVGYLNPEIVDWEVYKKAYSELDTGAPDNYAGMGNYPFVNEAEIGDNDD
jgi:hypothetical protein